MSTMGFITIIHQHWGEYSWIFSKDLKEAKSKWLVGDEAMWCKLSI